MWKCTSCSWVTEDGQVSVCGNCGEQSLLIVPVRMEDSLFKATMERCGLYGIEWFLNGREDGVVTVLSKEEFTVRNWEDFRFLFGERGMREYGRG